MEGSLIPNQIVSSEDVRFVMYDAPDGLGVNSAAGHDQEVDCLVYRYL